MSTARESWLIFQSQLETWIESNERITEMLKSGIMKTRVNGEDTSAIELERYEQMNISNRNLLLQVKHQIAQLPG